MLSFITEGNGMTVYRYGVINLHVCLLFTCYLEKLCFLMGEGNTVLVAIAGGEEEDVGKSGELVAGQDGVIG